MRYVYQAKYIKNSTLLATMSMAMANALGGELGINTVSPNTL